jgi:hypothetical protein
MEAKAGARKKTKRKKADGGKIVPLSMRTTAEIRRRMERAAEANGRSLASEVEDRLISSFNQDDIREAMFGGPELIDLFKMLAAAADIVERRMGKSWTADYETFIAVKAAWKKILNGMQPDLSAEDRRAIAQLEDLDPGPRPTPPTPPTGHTSDEAGLFGAGGAVTPEDQAAYERELAGHQIEGADWEKQTELKQQLMRRLLDPWDQAEEIGERAAQEALFPPPQGNG